MARSTRQTRSLKTCYCLKATHRNSKTSSSTITITRLSIYPEPCTSAFRSVAFTVANPASRNCPKSKISSTSATLMAQAIGLCCTQQCPKRQKLVGRRREQRVLAPCARSRRIRCVTGTIMTPRLRTRSICSGNLSTKRITRWTRGLLASRTLACSRQCRKF